ncbi:hypothetical protein ACS3SW_17795 [Roseobacteraceae bacterium S113]
MTSCLETSFVTVQMIFFAGVLLLYLVILIRKRGAVWPALQIMIGWGEERRSKLETGLGLGVFAVSLAAMGWLIQTC